MDHTRGDTYAGLIEVDEEEVRSPYSALREATHFVVPVLRLQALGAGPWRPTCDAWAEFAFNLLLSQSDK